MFLPAVFVLTMLKIWAAFADESMIIFTAVSAILRSRIYREDSALEAQPPMQLFRHERYLLLHGNVEKGDHLLRNAFWQHAYCDLRASAQIWYGILPMYAGATLQEWEAAIRPNTKMIYRTPTNPNDPGIEMIAALARQPWSS